MAEEEMDMRKGKKKVQVASNVTVPRVGSTVWAGVTAKSGLVGSKLATGTARTSGSGILLRNVLDGS